MNYVTPTSELANIGLWYAGHSTGWFKGWQGSSDISLLWQSEAESAYF